MIINLIWYDKKRIRHIYCGNNWERMVNKCMTQSIDKGSHPLLLHPVIQLVLCLTAKSWLRCCCISKLQMCNISWNQICISFEYVCISDLLQIDSTFGHLVMSWSCHLHCLVPKLPHCLGMPYWHYQLVLSLYLHQPESHQFSLHKVLELVCLREADP